MQLSRPELCADWGARMFSTRSPIYAADHYNIGSVFPYLTNFVTLALYEHGLGISALQLLESQVALCGFDGAGFVPEHLEGDLASPARRAPPGVQLRRDPAVDRVRSVRPEAVRERARHPVGSDLPRSWDTRSSRGSLGATRMDLELFRTRRGHSSRLGLRAKLIEGPAPTLLWWPRLPPLSRAPSSAIVSGETVDVEVRALGSGTIEALVPPVELAGELALEIEVEEGPVVYTSGKSIERGGKSRQVRLGEVHTRERGLTWQLYGPAGSSSRLPFHSDRAVRVEGARLEAQELVVDFASPTAEASGEFAAQTVSIELTSP
jgi:hypothetical protein